MKRKFLVQFEKTKEVFLENMFRKKF
jgi:hypothetical protein